MQKDDMIYKQQAIEVADAVWRVTGDKNVAKVWDQLKDLPPAYLPPEQPTLNGYNIKHLLLIAELLEKENLPPEKVSDALHDIDRIITIVKEEFEQTLRKAVEQCMR